MIVLYILLLVIFLVIYFLPSAVSFWGLGNSVVAITILNVFIGWTVIGWLICLIWAIVNNKNTKQQDYQNELLQKQIELFEDAKRTTLEEGERLRNTFKRSRK